MAHHHTDTTWNVLFYQEDFLVIYFLRNTQIAIEEIRNRHEIIHSSFPHIHRPPRWMIQIWYIQYMDLYYHNHESFGDSLDIHCVKITYIFFCDST